MSGAILLFSLCSPEFGAQADDVFEHSREKEPKQKAHLTIFTYVIWSNEIKVKFFGGDFKIFNYTVFCFII